jgi:hypothetical protein
MLPGRGNQQSVRLYCTGETKLHRGRWEKERFERTEDETGDMHFVELVVSFTLSAEKIEDCGFFFLGAVAEDNRSVTEPPLPFSRTPISLLRASRGASAVKTRWRSGGNDAVYRGGAGSQEGGCSGISI